MTFLVRLVLAAPIGLVPIGCGQTSPQSQVAGAGESPRPANGVVVYYMHRTFRCPTCLRVEEMARRVVQEKFADELASGKVRWQTLNYEEHEDLAHRYNVNMSSLVLVLYRRGQEVSHQVLERDWALRDEPAEFESYVAGAIRNRLGKAN